MLHFPHPSSTPPPLLPSSSLGRGAPATLELLVAFPALEYKKRCASIRSVAFSIFMKQAELGDDQLRAEISRLERLIDAGIKKDQDADELNKLRHTARAFRNRLAAKKSRISKRMSVKDMERRLQALEKENMWLRLQISSSDLSSTSTAIQSCSGGSSITSASSQERSDDEMTLREAPERPSPCPHQGSA